MQARVVDFIRTAEADKYPSPGVHGSSSSSSGGDDAHPALVTPIPNPPDLQALLALNFPAHGLGSPGLLRMLDRLLQYSVNTWHQGFLDKLYAATNAPGVAAELILAALNTNLHVYQVSPALSVIEKTTGAELATRFGLRGKHAGGISVQGGSASNTTSIVIARNTLFPETKARGIGGREFVLFTSAHGHYSVEKAAQMVGFGSAAVWQVPVDGEGRMVPARLEQLVRRALDTGKTPFYVNATAGTTVLGSFDPFREIAGICRRYGLWMHVDGSWGGSFIFSGRQKHKLDGCELADSIGINPHKMLGVPVTCSFLLAADLRQFHRANTLPAGYLFHNDHMQHRADGGDEADSDYPEVWDLADLTLQCGRRGDSLKFYLSWIYYGSQGYEEQINNACDTAAHLATIIDKSHDLILLSANPPPCLQVCFYYAPAKQLAWPWSAAKEIAEEERARRNSGLTADITRSLVKRGFMVDFAPPIESVDDDLSREHMGNGKFFRCVVNVRTKRDTVEALVRAVGEEGAKIVAAHR